MAIEYGTVSTDKGWNQNYRPVYPAAYGIGRTITGGIQLIYSKNATFSDWKGAYEGGSISAGYFSILGGSSSAYSVYGVGAGYGWGVKSFRGVTGTFSSGNTTLIGSPYYQNPYTLGSGPNSNTYYNELIGN